MIQVTFFIKPLATENIILSASHMKLSTRSKCYSLQKRCMNYNYILFKLVLYILYVQKQYKETA